MEREQNGLTIGAVAKAAGVNVETVRFYQRRALLPEPDKPYGRIRRYEAKDVARVRFVKAAQRLGFSLDEVAGLLRLDDGTHCDEARQLAEAKLGDVRQKPELDLAVVGRDDFLAGRRDERRPDLAALFRADRDILEVGIRR